MVESEGVKGRIVDEVMEGPGSQIRLRRELILGKQRRDQSRRLFRCSAEEMIVAWKSGVMVEW